jgi:choline transport protein
MRRKDEEAGTLAFTGVEQVTSRAPGAQDGTLKIRFSPLSMAFLCFTVVSTAPSWAGSLSTALYSGGPTVMVLGFLVVALCSLCGAASLAEMVSIWPTAEGQIAWTENMAPASCASFLVRRAFASVCLLFLFLTFSPLQRYWVAWLSCTGWVALTMSATFICALGVSSFALCVSGENSSR